MKQTGCRLTQVTSGTLVTLSPPRYRVAARAIDAGVVSVLAFLVTWMIWAQPSWYLAGNRSSLTATLVTFQASWCAMAFLYESLFLVLWRRTPGKYLQRLRIVSARDGQILGTARAIIRTLVPAALLAILIVFVNGEGDREMFVPLQVAVNWLIVAAVIGVFTLDKRRQGPHDKIARTLVIIDQRAAQPAKRTRPDRH
ncbi:RDD family protein [Candidatus Poriferisodalis sp.]|uniref:RDD family protein n=1 Tax=Candidatus Poriferisodalis sp. TaxID=3101277 RepID=UPI003B02E92B